MSGTHGYVDSELRLFNARGDYYDAKRENASSEIRLRTITKLIRELRFNLRYKFANPEPWKVWKEIEELNRETRKLEREIKNKREREMNNKREKKSGTKILYHVTNRKAAESIKKSGRMLRGKYGTFGGGIYFAETVNECKKKSQNGSDIVIEARVFIGNALKTSRSQYKNYTFTKLKKMGYDSIIANGFVSGTEYIVYNWAQVEILSMKDKDGNEFLEPEENSTRVPVIENSDSCDGCAIL